MVNHSNSKFLTLCLTSSKVGISAGLSQVTICARTTIEINRAVTIKISGAIKTSKPQK